jgi:hypothetical protein
MSGETTSVVLILGLAVIVATLIYRGLSHGIPGPRFILNSAINGCLLVCAGLILLVVLLWVIRNLVALT